MLGLGLPEILVILVLVFVLFGAGKLPSVMSDLGKGAKAFREGMAGESKDEQDDEEDDRPVRRKAVAARKKPVARRQTKAVKKPMKRKQAA